MESGSQSLWGGVGQCGRNGGQAVWWGKAMKGNKKTALDRTWDMVGKYCGWGREVQRTLDFKEAKDWVWPGCFGRECLVVR